MKKIIDIDLYIANQGDVNKLQPENILLSNNLDLSARDKKIGKIIPVSIQLGEIKLHYDSWDKKNIPTQMYIVTYLKNDIETTKTVAGHLINVEVEVVLSENFK